MIIQLNETCSFQMFTSNAAIKRKIDVEIKSSRKMSLGHS